MISAPYHIYLPLSSLLENNRQISLLLPFLARRVFFTMCKYISHTRACFICGHEHTVLISEKQCSTARRSGIFGSCGRGISSYTKSTPQSCWECKENSAVVSRAHVLQQVGFH
ncbi:hypothetical protein BKA67DRAFT_311521 [Truncatella angustata]|uniref:Uncharacterized protein n=1 Tax=Truncatella angustata TaxID=152316 RepID=A0A9P8ZWR6_9PEZI|nr:uncharacterized protein BKA67DRAFT_311521 [Truncatella angustata]KAH6653207.1 hypothetical protein BKA67DRAFT_311521 [Truncatella angustata]